MIPLSDADFVNLQTISKPFVDPTPEARISRLIRDEMARMGVSTNGNGVQHSNGRVRMTEEAMRRMDPDHHDSLTFTRVLAAVVDGHEIHRAKWNSFMVRAHVVAVQRLGFDTVKLATTARVRHDRYEEEGYKYVPEGAFSIQGLDAQGAWDAALAVARAARIAVKVTFQWREDGARPGETGTLEWTPNRE